jgi:hypothetical protein
MLRIFSKRDRRSRTSKTRSSSHRPTVEALESRALLAAVLVTTGDDIGAGSLRSAIESANADSSIKTIKIAPWVDTIETESELNYTGEQSLRIFGRSAAIEPADDSGDFDLLVSSGGADLSLRDLVIRNGALDGLFVPVPADATGTIKVSLRNVTVEGNGLYGVHIDDQTDNSDASIFFSMTKTDILANGFKGAEDGDNQPEVADFDGVRVDEGGLGSATIRIRSTTVEDNAADGVEIDEKGDGNVNMFVSHSTFSNNGSQPQLTDDLEDGLDIDEAGDGSIIALVKHTEVNRNEDEGIDFDEEGKGDLIATLINVEASENLDENIKYSEDADAEPPDPEDFDSEAEYLEAIAEVNLDAGGSVISTMVNVVANGVFGEEDRGGDGIKLEEFGFGSLFASFVNVTANGNDGEGIQIEEGSDLYEDAGLTDLNSGSAFVFVRNSEFLDNAKEGVEVVQSGDDGGLLRIRNTDLAGNDDGEDQVKAEGVTLDWV